MEKQTRSRGGEEKQEEPLPARSDPRDLSRPTVDRTEQRIGGGGGDVVAASF